MDEIFVSRTLDAWREVLATVDGVWAPVLSPYEVSIDPQALLNGYLVDVDRGDGRTYRGVASHARFGERAIGDLRGAPEHGQDTEAVLEEIGFTWDEIVALKARGTIV
jgi:crotonobetainyl-CoA:carnitine CoA-transferase CaiB-like acyl-CoA transferase